MFQLNAPVVFRAKVKEVQTNITIYSHTLLRIHIIRGQRSVRIAPSSLPPHHSHMRKSEDISPIIYTFSRQLDSYHTFKHQRNIDIFGHKIILSTQI